MAQTPRTRHAPPSLVPPTDGTQLADYRPRMIVGPSGKNFAREAAGNTSTFVPPTLAPGAMSQPALIQGGTPNAAAATLNNVNSAPDTLPPLGAAYGSSRVIPSLQGGALTSAPGSFASNAFIDPKTGKTALATASIPSQSQAASQASGIYVNGRNVTHDAKGNIVPVMGPADNPQAHQADAHATLKELYPDIYTAGSDANTKFLAAAKQSGLNGSSDPTALLALAKSALPEPVAAGPGNAIGEQVRQNYGRDAATAAGADAAANNSAATAAANQPSTGAKAAQTVTGAVKGTGSAIGDTYNSATGAVTDFAAGITPTQTGSDFVKSFGQGFFHPIDSTYNLFKGDAAPSAAPTTPTSPATPFLPASKLAQRTIPTPTFGPGSVFPSFAPQSTAEAPSTIPGVPSDDELKRRQAAAAQPNNNS